MPLGVSEGLIQKAYGAVDFSGLYKTLDAFTKKIAAEGKAYKDNANKEYYKSLADLNKETKGVRAIDIPEVNDHFLKWKQASMALSSNPRLFQDNPKKFGELMSAQDDAKSKLLTLSAQSKELSKASTAFRSKLTPDKMHDYEPDALKSWTSNVDEKKAADVFENGYHDESKYLRKDVDLAPIAKAITQNVDKAINGSSKIESLEEKEIGKTGERHSRKVTYDKTPNYAGFLSAVSNGIDEATHSYPEKIKAANQMLNEYKNTDGTPNDKLYDLSNRLLNVDKDAWKRAGNDDVEKLFPKVKTPNGKDLLFFGDNPIEQVAKIQAAEKALSKLPLKPIAEEVKNKTGFDKMAAQFGYKKAFEIWKEQNLDMPDYRNVWGGKVGREDIAESYNSSSAREGTMTPLKIEFDGRFTKATDPQTVQTFKDLGLAADKSIEDMTTAINQRNKSNGLPYNITADDIRSNRVLDLRKVDKDGKPEHVFLSTADPTHADFLTSLTSKKSTVKAAQARQTRLKMESSLKKEGKNATTTTTTTSTTKIVGKVR